MTDLALDGAARASSRFASAFSGMLRAALATYRLGGRTLLAAPAIVAVAVLPEIAQHGAEIHLGMFASKDAFRAAAEDPLRWAFAYPKVAGFTLAILLTARFWALGSVRKAFLIGPATLGRVLFAFALTLAAELPFNWAKEASGSTLLDGALTGGSVLLQAGLLVYLVAALLEDRAVTLRTAFAERWPTALLITLLGALALVPAQMLHQANHLAAMGQPLTVVWALMLFDSLWVGLMAALLGAALFVGFFAGPTWRGWSVRPVDIA